MRDTLPAAHGGEIAGMEACQATRGEETSWARWKGKGLWREIGIGCSSQTIVTGGFCRLYVPCLASHNLEQGLHLYLFLPLKAATKERARGERACQKLTWPRDAIMRAFLLLLVLAAAARVDSLPPLSGNPVARVHGVIVRARGVED